MWKASAPVVVGVDGSDAAINAAKWAIDEAISRDVPLRIVHVTHIEGEPASPEDTFRLDVQYAESSLRAATAAVEATGKPVKIETEILWGLAGHRSDQRVAKRFHGVRRLGWYRRGGQQNVGVNGSNSGRKGLLPGRDHSVTSQRRRPRGPTGSSSLWRITPTTSRSSNTQ